MKTMLRWLRKDLTGFGPVCWFGGWLTNYGWGWNFRWFGGWFVWSRCDGLKVYWSPDATPCHERTRFFWRGRRR